MTTKVAILGTGNVGADLMMKIARRSRRLELAAVADVDPGSHGLALAQQLAALVTCDGLDGLLRMPAFADVDIVFDATSAAAHSRHDRILRAHGKRILDLTPAAIGACAVPVVNLDGVIDAGNVNLVSCPGQAAVPIVAAISRATSVFYGEVFASLPSGSVGAGMRTNINKVTETTARAIETIGGAVHGKAMVVLDPAESTRTMRATVRCLCDGDDASAIEASVAQVVAQLQTCLPGYRLRRTVEFDFIPFNQRLWIPELDEAFTGLAVSVFVEVEGEADHPTAGAGNLDIIAVSALRLAETMAAAHPARPPAPNATLRCGPSGAPDWQRLRPQIADAGGARRGPGPRRRRPHGLWPGR